MKTTSPAQRKRAGLPQELQIAMRLHRNGELDAAKVRYEAILRAQRNHFDARHLLGVVLFQQGSRPEALDHIREALKWNPRDHGALSNLGLMLLTAGRSKEALAIIDRSLAIKPGYPEALYNRGAALADLARPGEALASYDKALAGKPNYAEALNGRGLALTNLGRLNEALASFDKALAAKPSYAEAFNNRGNALLEIKRFDEALASYVEALRVKPNYAEALNNRGITLARLGRVEEALASFDEALAVKPDDVAALNNRGNALVDLGRPEEALANFDSALAIKPDYADALNDRGDALKKIGRLEEALASFEAALAIKPDHVEALNNRGVALRDLGRPEEGLASFEAALAIKPDHAEALNNRGVALRALARPDEALASYEKALAVKPNYADALNNRGVALRDLERSEEALASFEAALAVRPGYPEALSNRGNVLRDLERPEESLASFDQALAVRPDYADAIKNRAFTSLLIGDFDAGWRGYERRWDAKDAAPRMLVARHPEWRGQDIAGKRILVYEEQGAGDVIQFSRYLTRLSESGASVAFLVRANLHRILRPFASMVRLIDTPPEGETFDFQCALLSLPGAFGTTLCAVPSKVPYLTPEAALVERWRARIGAQGLKIGICWQGNPSFEVDVGRSVPLRCFRPIAMIPGVRLISLQKNHGLHQLRDLPEGMKVETLGAEFDGGPDAFVDAAAAMCCLDLIITSDTSVAHLAGALARPVWIVLKRVPEWRWMLDRPDSPWYPTMKLYRQTVRDDWASAFERIAADLLEVGS